MLKTILVIEDENTLRQLYQKLLEREGYKVITSSRLEPTRELLAKEAIHLIMSDVRLPDGRSIDHVSEWKRRYPKVPIVLLTAYGNVPDSVKALKAGAYDYLVKGDNDDQIIPTLAGALESVVNKDENTAPCFETLSDLIPTNPGLVLIIKQLVKIAPTNLPILLTGESGTGKEVLARAIHAESRSGKPWVALNCAAFPPEMLESELFGHAKGAFTGAITDKTGLVEMAQGGTLFLDEIGEMPTNLQAKLLRLLENGEYYRLGETRLRKAGFRLITATNQYLLKLIQERKFREDLYYRINDFEVAIPPLRDRPEDIPFLANKFLSEAAAKHNPEIKTVSSRAMLKLQTMPWPGNVRQLRKSIERAVVLGTTPELDLADFPAEIGIPSGQAETLPWNMQDLERKQILRAITHTKGNRTEAAHLLGIGVATLFRKLKEYNIPDQNLSN